MTAWLALGAQAQQPAPADLQTPSKDAPIQFQYLTIEDGLSQLNVRAMLQDRRGFIWLGTQNGLNRFDGYEVTVFEPQAFDTTSLSHGWINDLFEDAEGNLWIATAGGVNNLDPSDGTFQQYQHSESDSSTLSSDMVWSVVRDDAGIVWAGTQDAGLNRLDPTTGTVLRFRHDPSSPSSISSDRVFAIHEDQNGELWIGTANGLSRFNSTTGGFVRYLYNGSSTEAQGTSFFDLMDDPRNAGVLWAASSRGLVRLDTETGRHTVHTPDAPDGTTFVATTMVSDSIDPHVFWIGTDLVHFREHPIPQSRIDGLHRFDTRTTSFTERVPVPARDLVVDRSGMVWSAGPGSARFHPKTSRVFGRYDRDSQNSSALRGWAIWGLCEDRQGNLWVAQGSAGIGGVLTRIDRQKGDITAYEHSPGDPKSIGPGAVWNCVVDHEGTMWIGTHSGLNRMDTRRAGVFTRFVNDPNSPSGAPKGFVNVVHLDRSRMLWIGSREGLFRMDTDQPGLFHDVCAEDPVGPCPKQVMTIDEDHNGNLWIGTFGKGIYKLDRESDSFIHYTHNPHDRNSLASPRVGVITVQETDPSVIWIGTDKGLDRFDTSSNSYEHFSKEDGLPNNRVFGILEDEEGLLWVSTEKGLSRFDPGTETFRHFDEDDGLLNPEYNLHSYLKSRTGRLFFGGIEGIDYVLPQDVEPNSVPPQISLTGLWLDNTDVEVGLDSPLKVPLPDAQDIQLPPGHKSITFELTALHYQNPERNQYAYRLEGYDDDWIDAGTRRTATYTNLDPGSYVFRAKAANSDGIWDEKGLALSVMVLPPWWRTKWAYVMYVLLIGAGIVTVDRVQRRRLLQRAELERKREVEAMNEQLRAHEEQLEHQNRRLEDQNVQLEEQARRLSEMDELKNRFFANISHEFRTPLTLILGPVRDFVEGHVDSERLAAHAPAIHRNGRRLLRLVNQLLDLSKLEAGGMRLNSKRRDVVFLLRRHVLAFTSRAERDGVALSFAAEPESIETAVDANKLEKVILNLLSNAFKFTPSGGRVHVAVEQVDDAIEIIVRDTGEGIPAEELPHVFDRFYQLDGTSTRRHEGSGIGLALSKELVELHGGTIEVESGRGFGSTFRVRLPIREEEAPSSKVDDIETSIGLDGEDVPAESADAGEGIDEAPAEAVTLDNAPTILLVEDNSDMRAYLRSQLQSSYRLVEAENGTDGLEKAKEHHPDLVISDVMMPEMDGFALCEAIRAEEAIAHVPVVLLTAKADEASRIEGLETGADDYLAKPFSIEELTTRVENLIEIRRRLRSRFSGEVRLGPREVAVSSADAAFVERVREAIEADMGEKQFGVDRLAEEVGLSRRQLHRRLKEVTDLTPGGYIRMMRLERAAQLLEQDAGLVSEVAYAVGFNDASYFSRLFRQTFGNAPSEFGREV